MEPNPYPTRKTLDHRGPLTVNTTDAIYFITIAAENRDTSELADHAAEILSAARFYQTTGKWFLYLLLIMPDHIHMLVHFPATCNVTVTPTPVGRDVPIAPQPTENGIPLCDGFGAVGTPRPTIIAPHDAPRPTIAHTIDMWKRYLARTHNIHFQRDFFDTRIRDSAHFAEKWNYICRNPVAKGLVATPCEWPHSLAFDPATGLERPHR